MSEVEREFREYDWQGSTEWRAYLDQLYPTPPAAKIPKFKRKFYRAKVNSNLSLDEPEQESTATTASAGTGGAPAAGATSSAATGNATRAASGGAQSQHVGRYAKAWLITAHGALAIGLVCVAMSLLPILTQPRFTRFARVFLTIGFLAATVTENGLPRKEPQYWQLLIYSSHMQAVLMAISGLGLQYSLGLVSPTISAITYLARCYGISNPIITRLATNRPFFEIMMGMVAIVSYLIDFVLRRRGVTLMGLLMYWNALRVLYTVSATTKHAFGVINSAILGALNKPTFSPRLRETYLKFSNWLHSRCQA